MDHLPLYRQLQRFKREKIHIPPCIQQLYAIEAKARQEKMEPKQRKELRWEKALPIINEFGKWMVEEFKNHRILPKSQIGKAFRYSLDRWEQLSAYLYDGNLEIDNNLVENAIHCVNLLYKKQLSSNP